MSASWLLGDGRPGRRWNVPCLCRPGERAVLLEAAGERQLRQRLPVQLWVVLHEEPAGAGRWVRPASGDIWLSGAVSLSLGRIPSAARARPMNPSSSSDAASLEKDLASSSRRFSTSTSALPFIEKLRQAGESLVVQPVGPSGGQAELGAGLDIIQKAFTDYQTAVATGRSSNTASANLRRVLNKAILVWTKELKRESRQLRVGW